MDTDLIIAPDSFLNFKEIAEEFKINFELLSENLQEWFDDERPAKRSKSWAFDQYNTYTDIMNFLEEMNAQYPENTQIFNIGNTFEGRAIKGIRITKDLNNPGEKNF
jgi:carboxypeptidase A